jgi:hypothetical protein
MAWQPPASADDPLWPPDGPSEVGKAPTPRQEGRFEPSMEDRAWAAEMSAKGLLGHHTRPLKAPRIRERGRWGTALKNWKDAGYPEVPPK